MRFVTVIAPDMLGPAYIARSKLEDAGIPCHILNEHTVGVQWLYANALGGLQVQVPEEFLEEALRVLSEDVAPEDVPEEMLALAPDLKEALTEPDHVCPRCDGTDVTLMTPNRWLFALGRAVGIPLKTSRRACKCRSCGKWWQDTP